MAPKYGYPPILAPTGAPAKTPGPSRSVTPAQKAALDDIIAQLYPFHWTSFKTDTAAFSWDVDTKNGAAIAKRNDGKAEVILDRVQGDNPNEEALLKNVRYWKAQSNDGFRMWKSRHEAYEGQGQKFDYSGTNLFLITIHLSVTPRASRAFLT